MSKYLKPKAKKGLSVFSTVLLLILVLAVGLSAFVWAKYIAREEKDTVVVAKQFYFESDLLTEDGATYTLAPGTTQIDFVLKNYADDLRFSEVDIQYKISVAGQSDKTGSLTANAKNSINESIKDLTAGTYTVTATATAPYTKALKATFTILDDEVPFDFSVNDAIGSPVARVTVWTNQYSGDLTIQWPEGVYPDNADPLLKDANSPITIPFTNNAEYTFVFFKSNPQKFYTDTDIKATKVS